MNLTHEGPGVFAILFECDPKKRAQATAALAAELRRLHRRSPSAQELRRAKNLLQTAWLQGYETFHHQAATIGSFAIDGQVERLNRYLPTVLGLKPRDLMDVVERYFAAGSLSSAVIEA